MYKQYFKQAWNLMKQNRFYSAVYIIGTGLAISMVMVMALMNGDSYAQLPGGGDPYKVSMMGTNDGFWRLYNFSFIDGKPFGEGEFQSAVPRVVLSSSLAKKLFSRTEVSGQEVAAELDEQIDRYNSSLRDGKIRRLTVAVNLFLLVNVFLAMIGTFWFRVNRRRSELGLRMAIGSSRIDLKRLVIGESLVILTIAAIPALLICLNMAYIDLLSSEVMEVTFGRLLTVSFLTWGILAGIITLAVWYPSHKAVHLEPAEALHYE